MAAWSSNSRTFIHCGAAAPDCDAIELERLSDQLVRARSCFVAVGDRDDHQLFSSVLCRDRLEAGAHGWRRAERHPPAPNDGQSAFTPLEKTHCRFNGWHRYSLSGLAQE